MTLGEVLVVGSGVAVVLAFLALCVELWREPCVAPFAMPSRPPRPCSHPGCGIPTTDPSNRCPAHPKRTHWTQGQQRMRGRTLQAARARLFKRQPLCVRCEGMGIVTLATIRDHVVPLSEGGQDDETNEQGLCAECHDLKTAEERQRGAARHQLEL